MPRGIRQWCLKEEEDKKVNKGKTQKQGERGGTIYRVEARSARLPHLASASSRPLVDSPGSPPRSPAAAAVDLFGFDGIQNIRSGQIRHEISVIGGKSQAHLFCTHVVRGRLYVVMVMGKSGDMFCFFSVISGGKKGDQEK